MADDTPKRRVHPDDLPPIFVHSDVDDLGLTLGAFRVYGHLARRAGKDNIAWPSYNTIGESCFRASYPKAKDTTLRRKAIDAVKELEHTGLITVERRTLPGTEGSKSNAYRLVTLREWRRRGGRVRGAGAAEPSSAD